MYPVEIGPRTLLAVAFFLVACGEGTIAPELGRSGASSSAAEDDDDSEDQDDGEDQDEVDSEDEDDSAKAPPSKKDAGTKHVSTPPSDEGPKDAGSRTKPVDAGTAPPSTTPTADEGGFDPGAGKLLADGNTVEYHIPNGTGGKDWNPKDKPIKVAPGMTLRLVDDDTTVAAGGGHWLHTYGQPCPHGARAIGKGYDCKIRNDAPMGLVDGTFEHNIVNGVGRLYIMVVKRTAPSAGTSTPR
ncbi:MAG TPA: hypothetical protein VI299_20915 [Polyangiales bacterium]